MKTLVTEKAPDFTAPAVLGNGEITDHYNFEEACREKYALLFFYPLDFTFVCPSELIALDKRLEQFKERNVEVVSVSVDSQYTHYAWRNTPIDQGGIGQVGYTMVADVSHKICKDYGVEIKKEGVALRASILIDQAGIVRHQTINDLPLGRDIDEHLRIIDALQFHETHGDVCPAGWKSGESSMKDTPEGVAEYLQQNATAL